MLDRLGWKDRHACPILRCSMDNRLLAAQTVAARLLAGPGWSKNAIADGLRAALGRKNGRARTALTKDVLALGQAPYLPSQRELAGFLYRSDVFKPPADKRLAVCLDPPRFAPALPFRDRKRRQKAAEKPVFVIWLLMLSSARAATCRFPSLDERRYER